MNSTLFTLDSNLFFCSQCGGMVMVAGRKLRDHIGYNVACNYCRGVSLITESGVIHVGPDDSRFWEPKDLLKPEKLSHEWKGEWMVIKARR